MYLSCCPGCMQALAASAQVNQVAMEFSRYKALSAKEKQDLEEEILAARVRSARHICIHCHSPLRARRRDAQHCSKKWADLCVQGPR